MMKSNFMSFAVTALFMFAFVQICVLPNAWSQGSTAMPGASPTSVVQPPQNTGRPVQIPVVTQTPVTTGSSNQTNGLPPELFAILQSVFGMGNSSIGGSGTSGSRLSDSFSGDRELARSGSDGRESYSTDSYSKVKPSAPSDLTSPFAIVGPFRKYFDGCVGKAGLGSCRFVNLGIKGDASHQKRRSCHNSAQAIDVGPLTCSSGKKILASDPQYFEVAKCMANQTNNELQVIFYKNDGGNMIQKADHNNHMHIQLKNCSMSFG